MSNFPALDKIIAQNEALSLELQRRIDAGRKPNVAPLKEEQTNHGRHWMPAVAAYVDLGPNLSRNISSCRPEDPLIEKLAGRQLFRPIRDAIKKFVKRKEAQQEKKFQEEAAKRRKLAQAAAQKNGRKSSRGKSSILPARSNIIPSSRPSSQPSPFEGMPRLEPDPDVKKSGKSPTKKRDSLLRLRPRKDTLRDALTPDPEEKKKEDEGLTILEIKKTISQFEDKLSEIIESVDGCDEDEVLDLIKSQLIPAVNNFKESKLAIASPVYVKSIESHLNKHELIQFGEAVNGITKILPPDASAKLEYEDADTCLEFLEDTMVHLIQSHAIGKLALDSGKREDYKAFMDDIDTWSHSIKKGLFKGILLSIPENDPRTAKARVGFIISETERILTGNKKQPKNLQLPSSTSSNNIRSLQISKKNPPRQFASQPQKSNPKPARERRIEMSDEDSSTDDEDDQITIPKRTTKLTNRQPVPRKRPVEQSAQPPLRQPASRKRPVEQSAQPPLRQPASRKRPTEQSAQPPLRQPAPRKRPAEQSTQPPLKRRALSTKKMPVLAPKEEATVQNVSNSKKSVSNQRKQSKLKRTKRFVPVDSGDQPKKKRKPNPPPIPPPNRSDDLDLESNYPDIILRKDGKWEVDISDDFFKEVLGEVVSLKDLQKVYEKELWAAFARDNFIYLGWKICGNNASNHEKFRNLVHKPLYFKEDFFNDNFKCGDAVQVHIKKKWVDGEVLEVKEKSFKVKYYKGTVKSFPKSKVRREIYRKAPDVVTHSRKHIVCKVRR